MSFQYIWDSTFESLPDNNSYGYQIDDYFRQLYVAIRERMQVDHIWKMGDTDGEHSKITFDAPGTTPLSVVDKGFLYTKDVSAKAELHFEDEDGHEIQITNAGGLKVDSAAIITILQSVYPVGCIYTTIVATNPAIVFGFGTWAAFGAGKVLVGLDGADTDFDVAEETGGAKTVAGAVHGHDYTIPIAGYSGDSTHYDYWTTLQPNNTGNVAQITAAPKATTNPTTPSPTSVVQPYIVVYFWKRTA